MIYHIKSIFSGIQPTPSDNLIVLEFGLNALEAPDKELHDFILAELCQEDVRNSCKALIIDSSLSTELSDLSGVRLAAHIRLSHELGKLSSVPIGITSLMPVNALRKLSGIRGLIDSEGIYHLEQTTKKLNEFVEKSLQEELDWGKSPNESAEELIIPMPGSYLSDHSLRNEWAVVNWANKLSIKNKSEGLLTSESKVNSSLHLKQIRCQSSQHLFDSKFEASNNKKFTGSLKIALIDDQEDIGWNDVFSEIAKRKNLQYNVLKGLKGMSMNRDSIIEKSIEFVKQCKPDIILLDIRLHSSDYDNNHYEELSSMEIMRRIEQLDKGIQIVILSATTRISIFRHVLEELNCNGFVQKGTYKNWDERDNVFDAIESLENTLNDCFSRHYSKSISHKQSKIKSLLQSTSNNHFDHNKVKKIELIMDLGLKSFHKTNDREGGGFDSNRKLTFLIYFGLLEELKKISEKELEKARISIKKWGYELKVDSNTGKKIRGPFSQNGADKVGLSQIINTSLNELHGIGNRNSLMKNIFHTNQNRNDIFHNGKSCSPKKMESCISTSLNALLEFL